jgi:hypothetical protein
MGSPFSYEPRTGRLVGSAAGHHFSLLTHHVASAETGQDTGDVVTRWGKEGEFRPGAWTPWDHSFEMPAHRRPAARPLRLSLLREADRLRLATRDCLLTRQGPIMLAETDEGAFA